MGQVELLAPAGSVEAFYGALKAGADAVYLAGDQYGARAYADNFSMEELLAALRYAHLFHRKVYLTVNTLLKDAELESLPAFLRPLTEEGLDGVIVQDPGVLRLIRNDFPGLPLHASTQMSVTGSHGAGLLKDMGVVRVVPARELSLDELRILKHESGLELETFIHGAMCYCYSGQCLFSSVLGGRSGNRGRCAQPCRLPYQVVENGKVVGEGYPLSMRDMCTLELLPELVEAGIDSFKIEGRMKKPEYAAGVTAFYRKYLDKVLEGRPAAPSKEDQKDIRRLYVRSELGTGYYHVRNGPEMIAMDNPAYCASDEKLLSRIRERYLTEKETLPVEGKAFFRIGQPAGFWICAAKEPALCAYAEGEVVEAAKNAPLTKENVRKQLTKLGDSPFSWTGDPMEALEIEMEENLFYSLKSLNELRRKAIQALWEVILHA